MKATGWGLFVMAAGALAPVAGCYVPKSELVNYETTNRVLAEQNRAQLVEIQNLEVHSRQVEDQLIRAEQELAARDQADPNSPRLYGDPARAGLSNGRRLPASVSQQLLGWARQYPNLNFDAETGVSKCDMDVLFDSGQSELKPSARTMLTALAQVLQLAEAKDLKIMVVGHTDNQRIVGQEIREKYANNFHLSTARALAVADLLRSQGLSDQRIGVAGFGAHEPVVANDSALQRQKNRRVEIFVMPRDVPVVGWSDATPGSYY
jgi:flagellar motor protein MotB